MASEIQNLIDKRGRVIEQMKAVVSEAPEGKLTKEDDVKFNSWDAECIALTEQINKLQKVKELEAKYASEEGKSLTEVEAKKVDPKDAYKAAFEKYARFGAGRLTEDEFSLLEKFNPQAAAEQTSTTTGGGYTIPEDFSGEIDKALLYYGPMMEACRIIRTSGGNPLPWPTNDDTGNSGYLLTENSDSTSAAQALTFGVKQLDAYNYTSGLIQVPKQLLQDEGVSLQSFLAEQLGERLGRIFNTATTRGTGSSQPQGFEDVATQGKVTAADDAITATEIIDLEHSVDRAYRMSSKAGFMLHDSILAEVKKLTVGSSDDRPIWLPSYREGEPDRLLGYKYWVNNDLDSALAVNNRTIFFGDWNKHVIRVVNSKELIRLDERFAEKYQVGWVGFMRFDSELLNTSAIKFLRQLNT